MAVQAAELAVNNTTAAVRNPLSANGKKRAWYGQCEVLKSAIHPLVLKWGDDVINKIEKNLSMVQIEELISFSRCIGCIWSSGVKIT